MSRRLIREVFHRHFQSGELCAITTAPTSIWKAGNWRSRPTASLSVPSSFPAATSAHLPFSAPSTILPPAGPSQWMSAAFILEEGFLLCDLEPHRRVDGGGGSRSRG